MGRTAKKELFKILLSMSLYILGRDILYLIDSMVSISLTGMKFVVFVVSFIVVYFYYNRRIECRVFFIIFMLSVCNLLSKILVLVPYNETSSLGILLAIALILIIGIPIAVSITDKIDKFLKDDL